MQLDTFKDQMWRVSYILQTYFACFIWYLTKNCFKINNILKTISLFGLQYKHNAYVVCYFNSFFLAAHLDITAICDLSYVD